MMASDSIDSPPEMDQAEARALTDQIRVHVQGAWDLLARVHAAKGWCALGYPSFEKYLGAEFDLSRSQGWRLVDQGNVIRALNEAVALPAGTTRARQAPADQDVAQRDAGGGIRVSGREAQRLKANLPEVVEEIRRETAVVPPAGRASRAREVVQRHLVKPSPPARQVEDFPDAVRTNEHVRLFVSRVVEQTADRLSHCCNADQLRQLADRAEAAWRIAAGQARAPATAPRRDPAADPRDCPECGGLTGDAGRGQRKCLSRGCKWTGRVA